MAKNKIVLIEDDAILSKVIYKELIDAGFDVKCAFDGEEGLKVVKSEKPNLILLDIILPKKNGFEVLLELRKSQEMCDYPVIMLTMLNSDEYIKRAFESGASDYIVKGQHSVSEIIEKIKDFFA